MVKNYKGDISPFFSHKKTMNKVFILKETVYNKDK